MEGAEKKWMDAAHHSNSTILPQNQRAHCRRRCIYIEDTTPSAWDERRSQ
jgi:hypothetical protein